MDKIINKKVVAVIFGGHTMEYHAACKAVSNLVGHIDRDRYDVVQIGVTKDGDWLLTNATPEEIRDGEAWTKRDDNKRAVITPIRGAGCVTVMDKGSYTDIPVDVVFPLISGYGGEDGKLQGLLELNEIPYVGSGVAASACGMDKELTRVFADLCGLKQPDCYILTKDRFIEDGIENENIIRIGYPVFVKPANGGTSVGITRVTEKKELIDAINYAFEYDDKLLLEQEILGSEIKVAVLGNDEIEFGAICELTVEEGQINDYETKQNSVSSKQIPANLDKELELLIKEQTAKIYKALDCKGFARVDFFLTREKELYFNEINTVPGLGKSSIYSLMFDKVGVPFTELLTKLIESAFNK